MSWIALTSAHIKARLAEEELEAIESTGGGDDNKLCIEEYLDATEVLKSVARPSQVSTFWSIMRRTSSPGSRRRKASGYSKTVGLGNGFCVSGLIEIKKALSINGPTGL